MALFATLSILFQYLCPYLDKTMILSAREYAKSHAGGCSARTVIRRAQRGLLPTNHKGQKVGNQWVIEIGDFSHLKDFEIRLSKKKAKR